MNETKKTAIFVAVAAIIGLGAYVAQPKQEQIASTPAVDQSLFSDFKDPGKAESLEIIKYSEDVGEINNFKVAKDKSTGRWEIPSHSNYPADAADQMRDAATMFMEMKSLGVASTVADDHKLYGVVEPDLSKLKAGDEGVGLRVNIRDDDGKELVNLIIGHKVKSTDDQRFVRIAGQDPVYTAKINPEKLSTKFEDWIEKDLLKINTMEVERLKIKDYSVVRTNQKFVLDPRMDVAVSSNPTEQKWNLDEFTTYKQGKPQTNELLEDEELNKTRLDGLKNALAEIKIVDVVRKPPGLGADLKAGGDFLNNNESVESLFLRGFYPVQASPDSGDLRAANGEIHAGLKDGYDYILRFGNIAGSEDKESKLTRYLFVVAKLDESKFPKPTLEALPELPAAAADTKDAPESKEPAKANDSEKPAGSKAGDAKGDEPKGDEPKGDDCQDTANADEPTKEDPEKPASAKAASEKDPVANPNPTDAQKPDDNKSNSEEPNSDPPGEAKKPSDPKKPDLDEQTAKIKAERERITRDNQRKLDDHKVKRKKAEEKVRELNGRFADWYYVISEDVYKKIHVSRADIIKERDAAKEEGFGVDAFRKLESEGIKKKAAQKPTPPGAGFQIPE